MCTLCVPHYKSYRRATVVKCCDFPLRKGWWAKLSVMTNWADKNRRRRWVDVVVVGGKWDKENENMTSNSRAQQQRAESRASRADDDRAPTATLKIRRMSRDMRIEEFRFFLFLFINSRKWDAQQRENPRRFERNSNERLNEHPHNLSSCKM